MAPRKNADAHTEEPTATEPASADAGSEALPAEEMGNSIPKSSATSAVTSDLPGEAGEDPQAQQDLYDGQPAEVQQSLGLVKVDGIDFRYVGIAPARDKDPQTETGLAISPSNSTFTPLSEVEFHPSIRIRDPKSGKFYFPQDGATSWKDCELDGNKLIEG